MTTMSTQHDIDVLYMYMYNKFRYGAPQKMFSTCNQMALIRVNILHSINFKLFYCILKLIYKYIDYLAFICFHKSY